MHALQLSEHLKLASVTKELNFKFYLVLINLIEIVIYV